jgi:hypothetical protein
MRGDLAWSLIGLSEPSAVQSSLLDAIPPLSELVLEIFPAGDSKEFARDVVAKVRRELPWSGFFSVKLTRERLPTPLKHVRVVGEPRAVIVPDLRSLAALKAALPEEPPFVVARDDEGVILFDDAGRRFPRLESRSRVTVDPAEALYDLIYLAAEASTHDDPSNVQAALIGSVKGAPAATIAKSAQRDNWSKLAFAFLRYVIARERTTSPARQLDPTVVKRLQELKAKATVPPWIATLIDVTAEPGMPFRAVVTPADVYDLTVEPDALPADCPLARFRRRLSSFDTGSGMQMTTQNAEPQWQRVLHDCGAEGLKVSQPVGIDVCDPPDPGCCEYRDFSRGVAEVIWSRPDAPIAEPRLPVVYLGREDEFAFGSAYLSATGAASLRLD